jgi:hypothetical protein
VVIDKERAYLLDRCLRLEAKIAALEGRATEVLPPPAPFPPSLPPAVLDFTRRITRATTPAEIAQMRDLRRRGMRYEAIAARVSRSIWTARHYTKDVLIEREGMGYE